MCGKVQRSREMPGIKELKSDSGYRTAQNQLHAGTTTTTQERNRDEVDALNHERRTKYHEARLLANKTACCIYAGVRTDSVQNETRRQFASGSGTPGNKNFPSYLGHGPGRSEKKRQKPRWEYLRTNWNSRGVPTTAIILPKFGLLLSTKGGLAELPGGYTEAIAFRSRNCGAASGTRDFLLPSNLQRLTSVLAIPDSTRPSPPGKRAQLPSRRRSI